MADPPKAFLKIKKTWHHRCDVADSIFILFEPKLNKLKYV